MVIIPDLLGKLDYSFAFIAANLTLFFYGKSTIKLTVNIFKGRVLQFLLFLLLVFIIIPSLAVFVANEIMLIQDLKVRWGVIGVLLAFTYYKFQKDILTKDKGKKKR